MIFDNLLLKKTTVALRTMSSLPLQVRVWSHMRPHHIHIWPSHFLSTGYVRVYFNFRSRVVCNIEASLVGIYLAIHNEPIHHGGKYYTTDFTLHTRGQYLNLRRRRTIFDVIIFTEVSTYTYCPHNVIGEEHQANDSCNDTMVLFSITSLLPFVVAWCMWSFVSSWLMNFYFQPSRRWECTHFASLGIALLAWLFC